jgi:hypothetical protein
MAWPAIRYNVTVGSDTFNSGAGPDIAVSGISGAHTSGVSQVKIFLTGNPDLSAVASDGSHALWLGHSGVLYPSLVRISAVDDVGPLKSVSLDFSNINIPEDMKLDWGIGGYRKTLTGHTGARADWDDPWHGWAFEFYTGEYTFGETFDLSLNDNFSNTDDQPFYIRAATGQATKPVLKLTADVKMFDLDSGADTFKHIVVSGLEWTTDGVYSNGHIQLINFFRGGISFHDCLFTITSDYMLRDQATDIGLVLQDCYFSGTATKPSEAALETNSLDSGIAIINNVFKDCSVAGKYAIRTTSSNHGIVIANNLIMDGAGAGLDLNLTAQGMMYIAHNTVVNNSQDGIAVDNGYNYGTQCIIQNNLIALNGGYGINYNQGANAHEAYSPGRMVSHNAFYNNTSGPRNVLTERTGDIELTVDPFTDSTNEDYSLNDHALGGRLLKEAGFPQFFPRYRS